MDWHQQYIGKVKQAVFHTQKTGRKRVVVSTEENVVASLDLRHGQICVWRHVLWSNDVIDGIDIALGKYVITLSSGGSILRAWNLPDGQMVWESSLQGPKHSKSLLLVPTNLKIEKDNIVVIFSNGRLNAVSCIDGEVLWKKDFETESLEVQRVIQPPGSDLVYIIRFAASSQFEMCQINAMHGELLKHEIAAFSGGFLEEVSQVSSETIVALDSTGSILLTISFQNGKISFQQTSISNLVEDPLGPAVIIPSSITGVFAIKTNAITIFIRVIGEGNLEVVKKTNHETAVSDALSISEGQQAFALIQHVGSEIHLIVKLTLDWDGYFLKESITMDQQRGHVHEEGEIVWTREDGLASIIDVTTSELPMERDGVSVSKVEHNIFKWLMVVHTQAKVIADQDVMYKYISRNLLFVATVAPKGSGEIGSMTPEESWLVAYVIDTVTGRILHQVTHHGSQGPVHAVFSENCVVYHYFNLRAHRYEMSVIEIYDQSRADNKDIWKLVLGKHNLTSPISLHSRPEVITKSQSYFFARSLKAIAVTSTAKGVTSKQLLIGTIGDQVLALDKQFLDPHRSVNPTQAEKEGIIALTDSLPIIPQSYITHAFRVEGLRGIITVPAKLESTTLVFAHGVDLFFTQLAPSMTYDSLTKDFSYAQLLITIVALVAAIFVTWILSERKELQEKWR